MFALEKCILPRKEPNHSFKLEPVSDFPAHNHKCPCDMCNQYETTVLSRMLERNSQQILAKIKDQEYSNRINSSSYQYILKRLILPNNKIITQAISVFIPEVCFYKDGEADSLYMNVDPSDRGKDMFRSEFFRERKDPMVIRLKKEKLTNTQIQKIFNEKRRKYREKVGTAIRRKISRKLSQFGKKDPIPQTKDAIIITYTDGYEQLQTENEFINLTLKRKQDPIFKKIDFIKNFIGVTEEDKRIMVVKHSEDTCKYEKLFERSMTLMKCYAANIQPGENSYISQEDEGKFIDGLQRTSTDAYAHYVLYKIINFIHLFYDEKITQIAVKFLLNQCSELYLLHVYSHTKVDQVKYSWTQEAYLKKVVQEENRFLERRSDLHEQDNRGHQRSGMIEQEMFSQYQSLKYVMGLAHVQKNDSQERANNAFFSVLYPNLSHPVSEILKDKGMTVTKFQQKYLGFKQKKRSVAQQFNSNLVKTLHKMAPKLKVAQGHQIQDRNFPKTPALTNRTGKRSFSMGNTLSTVNKTMTIFL